QASRGWDRTSAPASRVPRCAGASRSRGDHVWFGWVDCRKPSAAAHRCLDEGCRRWRLKAIAMPDHYYNARWKIGGQLEHAHPVVVLVERESRHQCYAEPGADHALDRAVVVGAEHHLRLLSAQAQLVFDAHRGPARLEVHQREVRDDVDG